MVVTTREEGKTYTVRRSAGVNHRRSCRCCSRLSLVGRWCSGRSRVSDGSVGLALMSFEVVAVGVVVSIVVEAVVVALTGVSTTVIMVVGCVAASSSVVQLGFTFRVIMKWCIM